MKRILTFACILMISTSTYCQTGAQYLKSKALQFSFNGLNLSSFGGGVGGKLWIDDCNALSLAIGGTHSYDNSDPNPQQTGQTNSQSIVQLQFGVEVHSSVSNEFSPYVTGAIFGRYESRSSKATYPWTSTSQESKYRSTNIGLLVGFGAEYWISNRMSLSGQQTFQLSYGIGSQEDISSVDSKQNTHGFDVGLGTSSLILAVYF